MMTRCVELKALPHAIRISGREVNCLRRTPSLVATTTATSSSGSSRRPEEAMPWTVSPSLADTRAACEPGRRRRSDCRAPNHACGYLRVRRRAISLGAPLVVEPGDIWTTGHPRGSARTPDGANRSSRSSRAHFLGSDRRQEVEARQRERFIWTSAISCIAASVRPSRGPKFDWTSSRYSVPTPASISTPTRTDDERLRREYSAALRRFALGPEGAPVMLELAHRAVGCARWLHRPFLAPPRSYRPVSSTHRAHPHARASRLAGDEYATNGIRELYLSRRALARCPRS